MKDDKIVCSCMNVTVGDIRRAIKDGARSFEEVSDMTGASTVCGRCREYAENVFSAIMDGE